MDYHDGSGVSADELQNLRERLETNHRLRNEHLAFSFATVVTALGLCLTIEDLTPPAVYVILLPLLVIIPFQARISYYRLEDAHIRSFIEAFCPEHDLYFEGIRHHPEAGESAGVDKRDYALIGFLINHELPLLSLAIVGVFLTCYCPQVRAWGFTEALPVLVSLALLLLVWRMAHSVYYYGRMMRGYREGWRKVRGEGGQKTSDLGRGVDASVPPAGGDGQTTSITDPVDKMMLEVRRLPVVDFTREAGPRAATGNPPATDDAPFHEVVVIGNGFDLECGLRSRFEDFFAPRRTVFERIGNTKASGANWGQSLRSAGLTAWDVALCGAKAEWWYDVEGCISRWVLGRTDGVPFTSVGELALLLEEDYVLLGGPVADCPEWDHLESMAEYIRDVVPREELESWQTVDVYRFLLAELHRLEAAFDEYLTSEVSASRRYAERAASLMGHLMTDQVDCGEDRGPTCAFVSFNYTRPKHVEWLGEPVAFVNVHGTLGEGIVFGIDGKDCMDVDGARQFTKTYRLMGKGAKGLSGILHGGALGAGGERPVKMIKFYGHSLSDPDYSYFQAIFDAVDLYGSDVRLVFYYRPWTLADGSRCTDGEARESTMANVACLLTAYGKTMDNKDHGSNLIHRLLIEERLEVKLLDVDVKKEFPEE